ncbi:MAG: galactokinase [Planctomycetaceae bacterium]|jgi:galactokinase|nr:galactokinase [Planctomycetaceae bacterium]
MPSFQQLVESTKQEFRARYGSLPQYIVAAPGRVNIIGEHTDYNGGFVFPMAIERYTVIGFRFRSSTARSRANSAEVFSTAKGEAALVLVDGSSQPPKSKSDVVWSSYIQGTLQYCVEAGLKLPPFSAVVNSNVPLGGGLSSSASLEAATATLAEVLSGTTLDRVEKALLCQKAEHHYAKMPCGIMDQFISILGQAGKAMLLDCRSCEPKMFPLDDPDVSVLIVNSNVKHELTGSEYPDRRRQCETAAKLLGVELLRDGTLAGLEAAKSLFGKEKEGEICFRRAKHVITEDDRTVAFGEALTAKNWKRCGELMYASHESMKNDFEITCPEIDALVEIAKDTDGTIGSRMTGGGFGGCTVSLVETAKIGSITERITEQYQKKVGKEPTIFATKPAQGASVLS